MTTHLTPKRERWLLLTLASIQFTSVLDFMIMMPLGPQLTALFGISAGEFGFLVSAYTFAAGLSGLLAATYIDRFGRPHAERPITQQRRAQPNEDRDHGWMVQISRLQIARPDPVISLIRGKRQDRR